MVASSQDSKAVVVVVVDVAEIMDQDEMVVVAVDAVDNLDAAINPEYTCQK